MTSPTLPCAVPGYDPDLALEGLQIFNDIYSSRDHKVLSLDHAAAVLRVLERMTWIASGSQEDTRPIVIPLQVGAGKTASVISWVAATVKLGRPYSIAVACAEVAALVELRKSMITQGVPSEDIGLLHRKRSVDFSHLSQDLQDLAIATPDNQLHTKRILLCCHNLIKASPDNLKLYNTYGSGTRDLVVYDEALLVSKTWSLSLENIEEAKNFVNTQVKFARSPEERASLMPIKNYFAELDELVEDFIKNRPEDPTEVVIRTLPEFSGGLLSADALNRLPDTNGRARHTHDITTARGLVKMAGSEVRIVHLSGHQGAITYQLVVPAALERVLVLDASFLVRSLGHVGSNVVLAEGATPPDIRYPDLEIHHYYSRSGRSYIEHRDSKKLVARIAEWIHREVGPGEFINIHTFKTRKGQTDVKADLLRKLEEHGVNTDMINVITFGSNQGSNEFSAAQHTIFYGVLERAKLSLAAEIIGQSQSLQASLADLDDIHLREMVMLLHQCIGRSSIRLISDGTVGAGKVLIPCHSHDKLVSVLGSDECFRDARDVHLEEWDERKKKRKIAGSQVGVTRTAIREALLGTTKDTISSRELRRIVVGGLGWTPSEKVWKNARTSVDLSSIGWSLSPQGFRRVAGAP